MPPVKLFMAPVRWNQMLLLCHKGRAVTQLKHGRLLLHGGKDFMEPAWMLLGYKQKHEMSWHSLGSFQVTFSCECSNRGQWFSRLIHTGVKPKVLFAAHHPVLVLLYTSPWHLWPCPEDDLFCPCHVLVLNTNAMVLCARHSWEQAVLFLATCPQLHISNPGPMGN